MYVIYSLLGVFIIAPCPHVTLWLFGPIFPKIIILVKNVNGMFFHTSDYYSDKVLASIL